MSTFNSQTFNSETFNMPKITGGRHYYYDRKQKKDELFSMIQELLKEIT